MGVLKGVGVLKGLGSDRPARSSLSHVPDPALLHNSPTGQVRRREQRG